MLSFSYVYFFPFSVVSRIGNEPKLDILRDLEEDLSLCGKKYGGMSSRRRRAHFSKRSNLVKVFCDPNLIYTFDLYEHVFDFSTFQVQVGMIKYDILKFLGPRPVQIMAVAWDPVSTAVDEDVGGDNFKTNYRTPPENMPYLFNLEVLNERSIALKSTGDEIGYQVNRNNKVGKAILSYFSAGWSGTNKK